MPDPRKEVVLISQPLFERLRLQAVCESCSVSELVEDVLTLWMDEQDGPVGRTQLAVLLANIAGARA